jgi:(p)ppGpp synthase/HD superfamily hydrolase
MPCVLQGRLKSLYSIHKKMQRKNVGLEEIYDARALRVVIDDGGNRQNEEAIIACYQVCPWQLHWYYCKESSESEDCRLAVHLQASAKGVLTDDP